ncbi:MAG: CDP-diacylglycerol--glycerol-3-phosphate 3-phosphatidyltransferase [Gemmataceae bacterium]
MDVITHTPRPQVRIAPSQVWNIPNALTTVRLGMAFVLFGCIALELWQTALVLFIIAAFTDWLDGYLARKQGLNTAFGRNFDPLVDKILVGGAFIFLLPVRGSMLTPWIVTLVIARELMVTGLRGYFEARATKFGADMFGKVKMVLQCAALIAILVALSWDTGRWIILQPALIYAMVMATALSGLQYVIKAIAILRHI